MSPGCCRLLAVLAHARRWRQTWPHPHISVNHLAPGSMAAPATAAALGQSCSFSRGKRWMSWRVEGSLKKLWAATYERKHLREASSGCGRLRVLQLSPPPGLKCLWSGYRRRRNSARRGEWTRKFSTNRFLCLKDTTTEPEIGWPVMNFEPFKRSRPLFSTGLWTANCCI